jgi:hypothetical protein
MLAIPSLLAAMTIAGAFWVGVLAARRLRDWGDGNRALEEREQPLALAAASGSPSEDPGSRRVRMLVAERLDAQREGGEEMSASEAVERTVGELDIDGLRCGDVVLVDSADPSVDGDYLIEGLLRLREGATTTIVATLADGARRRWLVGGPDDHAGQPWAERWLMVEPLEGHGIRGEPPRNIQPPGGEGRQRSYALERRGQASATGLGRHDRPDRPRVSTYLYRASRREVLWVERWGEQVLLAEGLALPRHEIAFLPGS